MTRRDALVQVIEALHAEIAALKSNDVAALEIATRTKLAAIDTVALYDGEAPDAEVLGDVVISLDTARRQATEGKRSLNDELARLLAHGILHLLGHDHEEPADARRMARAEVKLLGSIGMVAEALDDHPADLTFKKARVSSGQRHPASRKQQARPTRRASETRR